MQINRSTNYATRMSSPRQKNLKLFLKFPGSLIAARSCSIRRSWLMPPFPVLPLLKSPASHIQSQSGLPERYIPYG